MSTGGVVTHEPIAQSGWAAAYEYYGIDASFGITAGLVKVFLTDINLTVIGSFAPPL
jgi:hypothetical protein